MKGISEESSYQPHRKKDNMPSQQQKRKKQITYLAFQVMMRMTVELVVAMIMASSVIVMIFRHLCSRLVCIFSVWLVASVHHMLIVCFVWKVLCEHVFWVPSRYTVSSKTKILYFSVSITIVNINVTRHSWHCTILFSSDLFASSISFSGPFTCLPITKGVFKFSNTILTIRCLCCHELNAPADGA